MKDTLYLQRIREHIQSGRAGGVRATPAFFVNSGIDDASLGSGGGAAGVAEPFGE